MLNIAHNVKCFYCQHIFDRDKVEFIQVGARRYAHKNCAKTNEVSKTKEQSDLENLEKYIMDLLNEKYISPRVRKQINDFKQQYNYTYSGMLKSLVYFYEVKENPKEKAQGGIGIIPYVYNDAYNYYFAIFCAQQSNEDKNIMSFVGEVEEIRIKPPQRKTKIKKRFLDLEEESNE